VLVALALAPVLSRHVIRTLRVGWYAIISVALTVVWLFVVASSTVGYISPLVGQAFTQTLHTLTGEAAPRAPFQAAPGGVGAPLEQKLLAYVALAILAVALPVGLVMVWRRYRHEPLGLLLALAALGFFGVLALRVAPSAWELANRLEEFLFVGLAFV